MTQTVAMSARICVKCSTVFTPKPGGWNAKYCGPKTAAISEIRTSRTRILSEIESGTCVVRCANCHSVKTWKDKVGTDALA